MTPEQFASRVTTAFRIIKPWLDEQPAPSSPYDRGSHEGLVKDSRRPPIWLRNREWAVRCILWRGNATWPAEALTTALTLPNQPVSYWRELTPREGPPTQASLHLWRDRSIGGLGAVLDAIANAYMHTPPNGHPDEEALGRAALYTHAIVEAGDAWFGLYRMRFAEMDVGDRFPIAVDPEMTVCQEVAEYAFVEGKEDILHVVKRGDTWVPGRFYRSLVHTESATRRHDILGAHLSGTRNETADVLVDVPLGVVNICNLPPAQGADGGLARVLALADLGTIEVQPTMPEGLPVAAFSATLREREVGFRMAAAEGVSLVPVGMFVRGRPLMGLWCISELSVNPVPLGRYKVANAGLISTTTALMRKALAQSHRLENALRWYESTYVDTHPDDFVVKLVIAGESLCDNEQSEISLQFAVKVAMFIDIASPGYEPRPQLVKYLKELYARRSKLVHGAVKSKRDKKPDSTGDLARDLHLTRDRIRRALLGYASLVNSLGSDAAVAAAARAAIHRAQLSISTPID